MPFKFEKLEVWQRALHFANTVDKLTRSFPQEDKYVLSSQFKRAADSITLNIAEGSIGQSDKEQNRFLGYAIRSLAECVNCLHLAKNRNYISEVFFQTQYQEAERLFIKLSKFRIAIQNREKPAPKPRPS